MRNVPHDRNDVSEETWHEIYERAIERTYQMSFTEFEKRTGGDDALLLGRIQDRVAEAMANDFIYEGEW